MPSKGTLFITVSKQMVLKKKGQKVNPILKLAKAMLVTFYALPLTITMASIQVFFPSP
jgi:hypothetical protein